ncbi:MAG TPA: toll/interleukin-1 receptor domain-containing protein, partial [Chthonomonadales bacterium]|nr:toll/interleukin-1 receptor domain-containing protein [Chthonomonadales bacterium]
MARVNPTDEWLFTKRCLGEWLAARRSQLEECVRAMPAQRILEGDTSRVAAALAQRFAVVTPKPQLDQQHQLPPTPVGLTVPRHFPHEHEEGPVTCEGTRFTVAIPFTGDAAVLALEPSSLQFTQCHGAVRGAEIHLRYTMLEPDGALIKQRLARDLSEITRVLAASQAECEAFNSSLEVDAHSLVVKRHARLSASVRARDDLGLPVRQDAGRVSPHPDQASDRSTREEGRMWDVFICHASEDKDEVARPLARLLESRGYRVWLDEQSLRLGDSLRQKIDEGLARSRYGVVILSPAFLEKEWPQRELDGLFARELNSGKVILPVWHELNAEEVAARVPTIAGRIAVRTSEGLETVARRIADVLGNPGKP